MTMTQALLSGARRRFRVAFRNGYVPSMSALSNFKTPNLPLTRKNSLRDSRLSSTGTFGRYPVESGGTSLRLPLTTIPSDQAIPLFGTPLATIPFVQATLPSEHLLTTIPFDQGIPLSALLLPLSPLVRYYCPSRPSRRYPFRSGNTSSALLWPLSLSTR
jgi:hypothetical protein